VASAEDRLLDDLRAGDEQAFRTLVRRHHNAMRRVARPYVASAEVADEVVQETWLAVIRGLDAFEGRSSLKTWIFRILVNQAQARGAREHRITPFSSLAGADEDGDRDGGPTVDPERFVGPGEAFAGYWSVPPVPLPEDCVMGAETRAVVARAIGELPARQQQVIRLHDVEGWAAGDLCALLGISAGNQRVLLHRARAHVRAAVDAHFSEEPVQA
jgi:RNA polymerase sigma-70 factor (ECF subfamily)